MPESALFLPRLQEKGIEVPSVEEMASEDLSSLTAPTELRLMSKLSDFPTALANGTEDLVSFGIGHVP